MTTVTSTLLTDPVAPAIAAAPSQGMFALAFRTPQARIAGGVLLAIILLCVGTLPLTARQSGAGGARAYAAQDGKLVRAAPTKDVAGWLGYDDLGRSMLTRCLVGGTISLSIGLAAAAISVVMGVAVGLLAGYRRGWVDTLLMRSVDVLYGLPYILLVILFKIGFEDKLTAVLAFASVAPDNAKPAANLIVLFSAIGLVSWLTMARVVRGQVLSLRDQPFVEACKALGLPEWRIFLRHILPNLVGPITVYATLTVPAAILQESFLSFLGIGVQPPLPTWGSLASDAVQSFTPQKVYWWLLVYPCALLVVTLLSLNFLGDGLRDVFDPKREAAKI